MASQPAATPAATLACNPDNDGNDCGPAETDTCGPSFCNPDGAVTRFLWLEITGKCQLECGHCYADSGPSGTHGAMDLADWFTVLDQAAEAGVEMVQFIGGEPTLHPGLPDLIRHALTAGVQVEVYSNLVHVPAALWEVFSRPGVRLATSWYTDDPAEHAWITGRPTHGRTRAGIVEALRRSIPLRVGLVGGILDGQRVEQARVELAALGVASVRVDRMRGLGRAAPGSTDAGQLCGRCGDGVAAVLPDGSVAGCPMSRWASCGDIRSSSLPELAAEASQRLAGLRQSVITDCVPHDGCNPPCEPQKCDPENLDSPDGCNPDVLPTPKSLLEGVVA